MHIKTFKNKTQNLKMYVIDGLFYLMATIIFQNKLAIVYGATT